MQGNFLSPIALVFFRVFGAGILFWIIHALHIKEQIKWKDVSYFLLCSFIGIVLAQNTFLLGLKKTPTINASLIISTTPLMVAIFSVFILKESFTRNKVIGLLLALVGTIILFMSKGRLDFSSDYAIGNFLIFLNAVTYGLYLVLIKPLLRKYHPFTVIKWIFTFSSPFILLLSYQDLLEIEWSRFTHYAWIGLAYVVIFATFFTYSLNAYAIKILSPLIAGLYLYIQPLLTSLISIAFDKDVLTISKIIAGIFILTGLYFAAKNTFPQRK